MKKLCAVAVLVVAAAFAFGQGISIGGGLSYGSQWLAAGGSESGIDASESGAFPQFGFHAFVDMKYVQIGLGYLMNSSQSLVTKVTGFSDTTTNTNDKASWLDIDVVGKYPFDLGGFTLFPLAGAEYLLNLTYTDSSGNDLKASMPSGERNWLDALMLKVGIGADIPLSDHFYLRPEGFLGYKLIKSTYDNDLADTLKGSGFSNTYVNWWEIRGMVLVGYKL